MNMLNVILRNYKDLEGKNILGKIINVQRLEDRVILFKFYDETNMLYNYNYPPLQEFIDLKEFLREDLLDSDLEENFKLHSDIQYPMKKRYAFLYLQESCLKLYKDTMSLEEVIYKKYLNDLIVISYFNRIEKRFERMWKKPKNKIIFLKRARKYFFNRNVNKLVNDFFVGNLYIRIFLKKILSKIIFQVFTTLNKKSLSKKKNRYIPLILRRTWFSYRRAKAFRQLYFIPGMKYAIIRTLKKRKFSRKSGQRTWFPKLIYFAAKKKIFNVKAGFFCLLQIKSLSENTILARNYIAGKTWFSKRRTAQKLKKQFFSKKKFFNKNLNDIKGKRN